MVPTLASTLTQFGFAEHLVTKQGHDCSLYRMMKEQPEMRAYLKAIQVGLSLGNFPNNIIYSHLFIFINIFIIFIYLIFTISVFARIL